MTLPLLLNGKGELQDVIFVYHRGLMRGKPGCQRLEGLLLRFEALDFIGPLFQYDLEQCAVWAEESPCGANARLILANDNAAW